MPQTPSQHEREQPVDRPFGRNVARELNPSEIETVGGAGMVHTHHTGARGDDPSDSGGDI
jgi:hypothetical protein